jgi:hypothetical protein
MSSLFPSLAVGGRAAHFIRPPQPSHGAARAQPKPISKMLQALTETRSIDQRRTPPPPIKSKCRDRFRRYVWMRMDRQLASVRLRSAGARNPSLRRNVLPGASRVLTRVQALPRKPHRRHGMPPASTKATIVPNPIRPMTVIAMNNMRTIPPSSRRNRATISELARFPRPRLTPPATIFAYRAIRKK